MTGRRVCKGCGATYHVINNPSKVANICDKCGGELYQRKDDNAETVGSRLDVYEAQTAPLIEYYTKKGLIKNIEGDQEMSKVLADICDALGR